MDIKKYKEFLYNDPAKKEQTFEDKVLYVANEMILCFNKAQKEENELRREEIFFTNSCKENDDGLGFIMKIQAVVYEFTYEEIKANLAKSILGKARVDEQSIEKAIFSLLEKKRKEKISLESNI